MSQNSTKRTKLGPDFDVRDVDGTPTTFYDDEQEMEDKASSSVKIVGEVIPESDIPSLGLPPQDVLSAETLHNVTGPCMAATWKSSDADPKYTARGSGTRYAYNLAASGSCAPTLDVAQCIADSAEQRTDVAQRAADAAEQRAVAAQSVADAAQAKQTRVGQELQNADAAFKEEKTVWSQEAAAARYTIKMLQKELAGAWIRLDVQGAVVKDVGGIGSDLRQAKEKMELQSTEMQKLRQVTDEMIEHVGQLTDASHQIDAERTKENVIHPNLVNSDPVHVQDTQTFVNEPAEHVQTVPTSGVSNLGGQGSRGQTYMRQWVDQKILENIRLGKQPAVVPPGPTVPDSSTVPMTSAGASTSKGQYPSAGMQSHAATSSQYATLIGERPPSATPYSRDAEMGDANRHPTIRPMPQGESRVVVEHPPQLPSGILRVIERIVQAQMERLGVHIGPHEANVHED